MSEEYKEDDIQKQWKAVRLFLKERVLSGEIPQESKDMRPKAVYEKYKDDIKFDYSNKQVSEKFSRMLRSLRNKQKDGDLENEDKPAVIMWAKSAAKQYIKKCFRSKTIPANYEDAEKIWKEHCEKQPSFARMKYDSAFVRRLKAARDDYLAKSARCEKDLEAFRVAKKNHPTPEFNSRGEPQWNGSKAQQLLKEIVAKGEHLGDHTKPAKIWEATEAFQVYSLDMFRDHIYQEERLLKFQNYVESLKKRKFDELQY
jgi:hypothetical protein